MAAPKSIAIIIGSSRSPRVGPDVVEFVKNTIQSKAKLEGIKMSTVDISEYQLPVYDEPSVPAMIAEPDQYAHEHSRRWAGEIASHDGYVLVSPEYNYGMPGGVKNAIDYIYHAWKSKPIAVVTYGLDGGRTSSDQISNTLNRMGLQVRDILLLRTLTESHVVPFCFLLPLTETIEDTAWGSACTDELTPPQVSSTRPQLAFVGGPTGADTGAAMMTGKLGKDSLENWVEKAAADIVKAFEEVRDMVLSPTTKSKA